MSISNLVEILDRNRYKIFFNTLFFEITNKCNLNCLHCYNESSSEKDEFLKIEDILSVIEGGKKYGLEKIILSGGEILLFKNIIDELETIINVTPKLGITVLTNGTMLSRSYISFFKKHNINLQLSLDGYNAETNDYIRGVGNFDLTISKLEMIKQMDFNDKTSINVVLNKINCNNIRDFYEIAQKFEIETLGFNFMNKMGRAKDNNLQMSNAQVCMVVNEIEKYIDKEGIIKKASRPTLNCRFTNPVNDTFFLTPLISSSGKIFLCEKLRYENSSIGNFQDGLQSLFYGQKFKNIISEISMRKYKMTQCKNCIISSSCFGGCPAEEISESGDLMGYGNCELYTELALRKLKMTLT